MPDSEPSVTELALYKMCRAVYHQYHAQKTHQFSPSLTKLHDEVEEYLDMAVDEFDSGEIIVTFVLKRSDLDGGN